MNYDLQRGFTLIELMVVVAIVAILAMVAYPSYRQQVLAGHRVEAKSYIMELASRQERFYTANVSYASELSGDNDNSLRLDSNDSPHGRYTLDLLIRPDGCSPTGATKCTYYQITAAATSDDPKCEKLVYDSRGVRSHEGSAVESEECWK